MSAKQNKTILQRGADAFNNRQDRSGWLGIHDPSVVAHGLGAEPFDLDGLKKFYGALWAGFPDLRITIDDMVGEDEKVAWRLTARGTHTGEFRGVPATGKQVTFGAQYIFEFRDGRIVRRWTTIDRLGLLVQLGAVPAPV